ncbi:MAG: conjugal transfer protein TraF, partial [Elusimicrobia bacterium]|nr:conjugal transfer protein TraF [Elusimicrobiota bacterium]
GAMGAAVTSFKTAGLLQENMGLLHYSRLWGNRVSAGVNLKYLYHDYLIGSDPSASMSAVFSKGTSQSALTMDAGVLYRPFQKITLGLSGRNLTQPDVGLVSKDTVPSEYQAGVAWRPNNRLTAALDAQYRNQEYGALDDKSNVMLGLEYLFPGRFRTAGARMGVSLKEVTGGMGLQLWPQNSWSLRLDYAYALILNMANDSSGSHRVGLSFAFGKKQDAAGNAAGTK